MWLKFWTCDSPASISLVAEITGVYPHVQLVLITKREEDIFENICNLENKKYFFKIKKSSNSNSATEK